MRHLKAIALGVLGPYIAPIILVNMIYVFIELVGWINTVFWFAVMIVAAQAIAFFCFHTILIWPA